VLDLSTIGFATAFVAGLISFLSPCVLPLVPAYVSFIAGKSFDDLQRVQRWHERLAAIWLSLWFVLGFSVVFVAFGASATALSRWLLSYKYEAGLVAGAAVILFGLLLTGLVRVPWLERDHRFHTEIRGGRPVGAFALGLAFAFGWTPCIGPVLGAILTVSASSAGVSDGIYLLSVYSLGLGVPFVLAAASIEGMMRVVRGSRRTGRVLQVAAGGVMVAMGVAMITGDLTALSFWLLKTFPGLALIG
jgi:cytochrome c-type biogenesis protein